MAAPRGNEFWKMRSKHGRDKIFSTPEILWDAACEYFQWASDTPLTSTEFVGNNAIEVEKTYKRPYTIWGLCIFLDCTEDTFDEYGKLQDFSGVVKKIRQIIKNQKFEGAAVGLYNASIIARDLGLRDKQDVTTDGKAIGNFEITLNLSGDKPDQ